MTSFVVRSAKRFHQYSPSMRLKSVVWLWYPTRILCGSIFSATSFTASAVFFSEVARLVDLRRERPDDQVAVADRLIELDRRGELVALQLVEAVVESARLELGGVEVLPPLGARFAERVLELDGVEADSRERVERAGNLGRELLPHTPELRADRDAFPLGSCGGSREGKGERRPRRCRRVGGCLVGSDGCACE